MPRKVHRTEWRAIALDMAIETSTMEVLCRGRRQKRAVTRVILRTERGQEFSGPRIGPAMRRALEQVAASEPWLGLRRHR